LDRWSGDSNGIDNVSPPNGFDTGATRELPQRGRPSALTKARSLLMLLLATCKETQLALEAAANALDTDLTADLGAMIERSEAELVELNAKIKALPLS
jgi:hypothetical protein